MSHVSSISKYLVPLAGSKMLFCSAAFLLGIITLTPDVMAGNKMFFGPQGFENEYHSVSSIQAHCHDDEIVVLRGRLTNYLYKDNYEFTDENGATIEVELEDHVDWSYVHKDQLIEIMGEVERNMFKIKIEAKAYRILETSAVARERNKVDNAEHLDYPNQQHLNHKSVANTQSSKESLMPNQGVEPTQMAIASQEPVPVATNVVEKEHQASNQEPIEQSELADNNQAPMMKLVPAMGAQSEAKSAQSEAKGAQGSLAEQSQGPALQEDKLQANSIEPSTSSMSNQSHIMSSSDNTNAHQNNVALKDKVELPSFEHLQKDKVLSQDGFSLKVNNVVAEDEAN